MCRLSKRCDPVSAGYNIPASRAASAAAVPRAEQTPANTAFDPATPDRYASVSERAATLPGWSRGRPEWPLPALTRGISGVLTSPGRGGVADRWRTSLVALFPALHDRRVQPASAAG